LKVFFDECIDWRLSRETIGHELKTARQTGWSTIKNGELLALASREFDVFVTVDRNLSFQQDLPAFAIAVIVLRARTNRLFDLLPLEPELLASIPRAKAATVTYVGNRPHTAVRGRSERSISIAIDRGPPNRDVR